ncbi:MAG: sensor histidine kinase, partial [Bacteroidota bacterium]
EAGLANRREVVGLFTYPIPLLLALWGYEQWRWLKNLQADKTKAELALLKNQLNPHFLFNTLNNLYGLAVEKADETPEMILKLSSLLRYTIYDGRADFVPLADEVTYLEHYLELQKIRLHRQVDISFTKDLADAHEIAPLLLIVPLENAFKHGVERHREESYLHLEVRTTPEVITFSVRNNYLPNLGHKPGIGLSNLQQRLEHIYPRRHELVIKQTPTEFSVSLKIEPREIPHR